jgi:hypothetical protein
LKAGKVNPLRLKDVRRVAAMGYHILTLGAARRKLDRLAQTPDSPTTISLTPVSR